MEYSNPEIPEGINTSKTHPLKEFMVLTVSIITVILIVLTLIISLVDSVARYIPFEWEQVVTADKLAKLTHAESPPEYLKKLSDKILLRMQLEDNMDIHLHYVNDDTINAFATLGGHIVIYRGLLEKLKHEDELAMVLAHEMSHIKHRHPILAASHGVVISIVLSLLDMSSADDVMSSVIGTTGMVSLTRFSRDYEYQADEDAIRLLVELYGHANGANELFELFSKQSGDNHIPEFLNTHPLSQNRINQTNSIVEQYPPGHTKMTPLPDEFHQWLEQQQVKTSIH